MICESVKACNKCCRMSNSSRILSLSSGSLDAKIMFIGEAPGRLGADSTGIPFHGDKAGHNFESLLQFAKISREEIFVTNAVLCNPKDEHGNNATPNAEEISNCSDYLKRQIETLNPAIVVTLGATALKATRLVAYHSLSLKENVRTATAWMNRILIPLYHPGQRAMLHRSFANQRSDYQFIADQLRRLGSTKSKPYGRVKTDVAIMTNIIFSSAVSRRISYFALHKIFYLLEYSAYKEFGERLTSAFFIRQKDGPYCTDLHLNKLKSSVDGLSVQSLSGKVFLSLKNTPLFQDDSLRLTDPRLDRFVRKKVVELSSLSDKQLKTKTYLSSPMRKILRLEKEYALNTYNAPIVF